ncbi:hypothetical protein HYH03_016301 [Edaphochlamys debaryana]|uniref:Uncharacterized protein n=1 Tax=Edaphochlamys debaryana TaxID=47281 RepID=A0A836BQ99_9CHLO|nr:hypothetical protein HYH03_016301 [Edaphochlamys debaryana]|eukprot:KAG2484915.1 hypothetical protein HYH03_016301 [Edaphochlamys debaryana]
MPLNLANAFGNSAGSPLRSGDDMSAGGPSGSAPKKSRLAAEALARADTRATCLILAGNSCANIEGLIPDLASSHMRQFMEEALTRKSGWVRGDGNDNTIVTVIEPNMKSTVMAFKDPAAIKRFVHASLAEGRLMGIDAVHIKNVIKKPVTGEAMKSINRGLLPDGCGKGNNDYFYVVDSGTTVEPIAMDNAALLKEPFHADHLTFFDISSSRMGETLKKPLLFIPAETAKLGKSAGMLVTGYIKSGVEDGGCELIRIKTWSSTGIFGCTIPGMMQAYLEKEPAHVHSLVYKDMDPITGTVTLETTPKSVVLFPTSTNHPDVRLLKEARAAHGAQPITSAVPSMTASQLNGQTFASASVNPSNLRPLRPITGLAKADLALGMPFCDAAQEIRFDPQSKRLIIGDNFCVWASVTEPGLQGAGLLVLRDIKAFNSLAPNDDMAHDLAAGNYTPDQLLSWLDESSSVYIEYSTEGNINVLVRVSFEAPAQPPLLRLPNHTTGAVAVTAAAPPATASPIAARSPARTYSAATPNANASIPMADSNNTPTRPVKGKQQPKGSSGPGTAKSSTVSRKGGSTSASPTAPNSGESSSVAAPAKDAAAKSTADGMEEDYLFALD